MPTTYKVLGQTATSGSVNVDLYTAPNNAIAVTSTLSVCPIVSSSYLKIACVPSGESIAQKNYIVYDTFVNQYDSLFLTLGMTLSSGDKIVVSASGGGPVSFSLFGTEIS